MKVNNKVRVMMTIMLQRLIKMMIKDAKLEQHSNSTNIRQGSLIIRSI